MDFSKAYDRVCLNYVCEVMIKMGFDMKWVLWIKMCLESVVYLVTANYERLGSVYPKRGLRQGDTLSSYLFIICVKGLLALLKQEKGRQEVHYV